MKIYTTLLAAFAMLLSSAQVTDLPDMNVVRSGHQLVCMDEEELVVLGGYDGESYLASVEVYDGSGWSIGQSMNVPRYSLTAHATSEYELIVIGGWDGITNNHSSTEIYYPSIDAWDPGPSLSIGRSNHRSIQLQDGRILVTGGYDGSSDLTSCEIIDPSDWSVSPAGDMISGRSSHALVLLNDGRVLAVGGFNPDLDFQMNECEIYDPASNEWVSAAPMTNGRDNHTAVLLPNGEVSVIGGRSFNGDLNLFEGHTSTEIYNVDDDAWSTGAELVSGSSYNAAYWVDYADHAILISGVDQTGSGVSTTFSMNEFNEYGPDYWAVGENYLTGDRFRFASCQRPSGAIVISGGAGLNTVQVIYLVDGVEEKSTLDFDVFPNPAHNVVTIRTTRPFDTWHVRSLDGRIVKEGKGNRVDVEALNTGSYQLVIEGASGVFSETLLVH